MEFLVLGPVEARVNGSAIPLPRRQHRALLAALVIHAGEVVSTDRLVDDLWGEDPPASAVGSLQNAVSSLRKSLGPELVVTKAPGYVLAADPEVIDARRFERLLAGSAAQEPATRAATLREALALWRGPALADVADAPWAELEASRLEALRITALEERIDAELELGLHGPLVAQLEALVAEHTLRERLARQLALALYRSGRQADAVGILRRARELLDELGLEPSAELKLLERDILQQSPAIAAPLAAIGEEVAVEVVGERRVVSVLAAAVPEDEDPDALRVALARVLEAANAAIALHGGVLERFGPEGLVAVFGAEASREDDALRAVRAGVELHESAGVTVGIATGDAVVADEPRVAGAAVARAAGLARTGGGVLLDPRTLELVRNAVQVETAGPIARVLAVAATRPEAGLGAPLIGRRPELEQLRSLFAAARDERRCVTATVVGEPGIGKTRLARELAGSIEATVLVGRCAAYGEGATFLPLVEALHAVDPNVAGDELVARRIAELGGATREPGSLGESYWAVRRLLEALATLRPVCLALDDVHWAEPALLDLVEYLRDRATTTPLLVLCLARPELLEERPGWAADTLRLEPLAEDETRQLVATTAAVEDEARERIVELAEGNPLYAQQLTAYASESGKALEPGELPASIDAVLAGRLGRLGADERATLQRAAVVGREFSRGAVAALAPPDLAVDAHLLALTRRGFLHALPDPLPGDDAYRFHHVLVRDAAYATLTKEQRADLHQKVAAWLDRDGPGDDAIVGYHLEQTAHLHHQLGSEPEGLANAAGGRLAAAGMLARRRGDNAAAIGLLTRAAGLLDGGEQRAEVLCELSYALRVAGQTQAARDVLVDAGEVARAARSKRVQARVDIERAIVQTWQGELGPAELLATAEGARSVFEAERDDRGLARAWIAIAEVHNYGAELAAYGRAMERAKFYYLASGFSPSACIGGEAEALFDGPEPVPSAIERCRALAEEAPDHPSRAHVLSVLGALYAVDGRFDEARSLSDEALSLYDDVGYALSLPTLWTASRVVIEQSAEDYAAAETLLRSACATLESFGEPGYLATRAVELADVLIEQEQYSDAEHFVEVAAENAAEHDVFVQFLMLAARARIGARRNETGPALADARRAVELASATDALNDRAATNGALGEVLWLAGHVDEGRARFDEAMRLFATKQNRVGLAHLEKRHARLAGPRHGPRSGARARASSEGSD